MNSNRSANSGGFGSFFRYHGWLSPGVRLFRSISFPAKASWISFMFMAPLVAMMFLLWQSANEQIAISKSERQGLTYVAPALELISAAQNQRRAATAKAPDLADMQSKVSAAFAKIQAKDKELGSGFANPADFEALSKAYQSVLQTPVLPNADDTFIAHTALIDAALKLIASIADGSQLSLDPQLDTYHLMNLSVIVGPQELENLAQLRGLGNLTLATAATKETPPQRIKAMVKALALIEYLDAGYENSYNRGIESFPEVAKTIDMKGTDDARDAFLNAFKAQIMIDVPTGDAAAFLTLANASINTQVALNQKVMARLDSQLEARIARLERDFRIELGLSALFVFAAIYLMLAFFKVMMGGLKEVAGHLEEITLGNLTTAPRPWGSDEAAQLMITMGNMQTSLRRIVGIVLDSSASVHTASHEIASASHDLSGRTESSAASLEETSASMVQISTNVTHTSEMVQGAKSFVQENAHAASRGAQVIQQVVSTMEGIRTSSNQIGEIIGVIDGIAFQTNILALNAAVEAARAGEQGRGFAVVATEVRALAGRSAAAAKEIKTLISASIDQVEAGNRVVAEAGTTIQVIVTNAEKIDAMMNEIATATQEQSNGVNQVGSAMHELDKNTQQNAALVEETAASASALTDQAQRLADEVSFFKLK